MFCLRIEFQCVGLRIDKVRSKSSEEKYIIKLDEDVIFAKDKVNFGEELKDLIISNEKINDDEGILLADYEQVQKTIAATRKRYYGETDNFNLNKRCFYFKS